MTPPLITLEEHWYSQEVYDSFDNGLKQALGTWGDMKEKLFDADSIRIKDMDAGRVALQVISHCAAEDPAAEPCKAGNDALAFAINKNTTTRRRFAGFATLPMIDPAAAAIELERSVKDLGFVGALVENKTALKGFADGAEYDVLWSKAEELAVPIYLHPSWPTEEQINDYYSGNYPMDLAGFMGGPGWGWHSETGLHVLRLHAAGVFDRFPKLKIVLGHFGEMIPYMLERIAGQDARQGRTQRKFSQVWDENIWVTTSGVWGLSPMKCLLSNTKVDRIMYSVDYPFSSNEKGLKWFEELESSGLLTAEQLEMIAHKNAEALLGVKAPV